VLASAEPKIFISHHYADKESVERLRQYFARYDDDPPVLVHHHRARLAPVVAPPEPEFVLDVIVIDEPVEGPAPITLVTRLEKAAKEVESFNTLCAPFAKLIGYIISALTGLYLAYQHFFAK
jgi:hypothetical protein